MAIVLLGFYTIRAFAFGMRFGRQNYAKNHSKTRPGPFKNRCRKHVDFQHRFFENLASIWEGLGSPRWHQVGHVGPPKLLNSSFFTLLSCRSFKNGVLEGSRLDFGGSGARFWRVWGWFLRLSQAFWHVASKTFPPVLPPMIFPMLVEPKHPKKLRICQKRAMEPCWPCWPSKPSEQLFFTLLSCRSFKNGVLEGSRLDGSEDVSSSTPSSDFSHPGRAETSKES